MFRIAIFVFLNIECIFLLSQEAQFSRDFIALQKNLPLAILNNRPHFFYVLRFNKAAHDMTIERRRKPSAEICAFTPLKMDSVNAGWFNYENLDYLFFEHRDKTFFLFQKTLNFSETIYLKIIDTSGKSSGFKELFFLEKDKTTASIDLRFKRTLSDNILIIATKTKYNGRREKTVTLFGVEEEKIIWTKRLPPESVLGDNSDNYESNSNNDLYYVLERDVFIGYETYYGTNGSYSTPTFRVDSLILLKFNTGDDIPARVYLETEGLTTRKNISLVLSGGHVLVLLQGLMEETTGKTNEFFVSFKTDTSLANVKRTVTAFDDEVAKQLTFYDGPLNGSFHKYHRILKNIQYGGYIYTVAGREEGYYYKELLVWKTDPASGEVVSQKIIPRKIFVFKGRTRFKNIANTMLSCSGGNLNVVMLESPSNFEKDPNKFSYRYFKKETKLWRSNIVMYSLDSNNTLKKKRIFTNSGFDLAPMNYESGNEKDMIFYLNNGKFEKFLTWNLRGK